MADSRELPAGAGGAAPGGGREPAANADPTTTNAIEERVQAALVAGTRTEASLSALFRAVREMSDGLNGARESTGQLVEELSSAKRLLRVATDRNAELEDELRRLRGEHSAALESLDLERARASRERAFLVEEQDRFLAALIEEHDDALEALEAKHRSGSAAERTMPGGRAQPLIDSRSSEAPGADALTRELARARREIDALTAERNRSREVLRRLQAQRDEAQRALGATGPARRDALRTGPPPLDPAPTQPVPATSTAASQRKTNPTGPKPRVDAEPTRPAPSENRERPSRHPTPPAELAALLTVPTPPSVPAPGRQPQEEPAPRRGTGYSIQPAAATERIEPLHVRTPPRS